jgi:hypothetical protein
MAGLLQITFTKNNVTVCKFNKEMNKLSTLGMKRAGEVQLMVIG